MADEGGDVLFGHRKRPPLTELFPHEFKLRMGPSLTLKHHPDHLPLTFSKHIVAAGIVILMARRSRGARNESLRSVSQS